MNKTELNVTDLCVLCGELMNNFRVNSKECTNFSGVIIEDLLSKTHLNPLNSTNFN